MIFEHDPVTFQKRWSIMTEFPFLYQMAMPFSSFGVFHALGSKHLTSIWQDVDSQNYIH
jgi:hypothetical protein